MASKKKRAKKPLRPCRPSTGLARLDRPPTRIYVPIDELGPHRGQVRLGDAKSDAEHEFSLFGEARVYEYRLVDKRPRAVVAGPKESTDGQK